LSQNLKKRLYQTKNYSGISGSISILADGTTQGIYPGLYQFVNGKNVRVEK
jgi:hypothetical protein